MLTTRSLLFLLASVVLQIINIVESSQNIRGTDELNFQWKEKLNGQPDHIELIIFKGGAHLGMRIKQHGTTRVQGLSRCIDSGVDLDRISATLTSDNYLVLEAPYKKPKDTRERIVPVTETGMPAPSQPLNQSSWNLTGPNHSNFQFLLIEHLPEKPNKIEVKISGGKLEATLQVEEGERIFPLCLAPDVELDQVTAIMTNDNWLVIQAPRKEPETPERKVAVIKTNMPSTPPDESYVDFEIIN